MEDKRTPLKAIRAQCVACMGGVFSDIKDCGGHGKNPLFDYCHFYTYRTGRGRPSVKTIRKFCLHCMNKSSDSVFQCATINCPVYQYRLGKNPSRTGHGKGKGQSKAQMAVVRAKRSPLGQ